MRELVYDREENLRVDVYISEYVDDISRSEIQRMLKSGEILVNDKIVKPSYRLELDDHIFISEIVEEDKRVVPIDYDLEVVYEDDDLIIVNKPQGIVVYPGAGKEEISVVAALLGSGVKLYETEDVERIGVVHRLDKDTSGLIVLSKSEVAHNALLKLFKERDIIRKYYALVDGDVIHDYGTIDAPIGRDEHNRTKMSITSDGREAKTFFKVKERYDGFTLLECELHSGRTHQIRVHMQYIKHPIIGDPIYRKKTKLKSDKLMLQSYNLKFIHPVSNEEMEFTLPLRSDFEELISKGSN